MNRFGLLCLGLFLLVVARNVSSSHQNSQNPLVSHLNLEAKNIPCRGEVEGEVLQFYKRNGTLKLLIAMQKFRTNGKEFQAAGKVSALLTFFEDKEIDIGSKVIVSGRIFPIRDLGTPGEFSKENWARVRGIVAEIKGRGVITLREEKEKSLSTFFFGFRAGLQKRLQNVLGRATHAPIYRALLLGEKRELSPRIRDVLIDTGVFHLFVVSGWHLAIVGAIVFFLMRYVAYIFPGLQVLNFFSITNCFALIAISSFTFFCPFDIPIARAYVAGILILIFRIAGKMLRLRDSMLVVLLVIFILFPGSYSDVSFQLSFVAVLGLCLSHFYLKPRSFLGELLTVTVACNLVTLPILAFHFQRISFLSIPTNLLVSPAIAFVLFPLLGLGLLFAPIASFSSFFLLLTDKVWEGLFFLLSKVASLSISRIYVFSPTLFEIVLFYLSCAVLLLWVRKKRGMDLSVFPKISSALSIAIVLAILGDVFYWHQSFKSKDLRLHFVSVGQGDAIFVEFPGGETLLVDCGRRGEIAAMLRKKRRFSLDIVAITHPDLDHIGGMRQVLEEFRVREIWLTKWWDEKKEFEEILRLAREKKIPLQIMHQEVPSVIKGGAALEILWPPRGELLQKNQHANNEFSLVLRLTHGKHAFLLTGDIGEREERKLLKNLHPVSLLKIPHHGSASSSSFAFLKRLKPELAICSVGAFNSYGLPKKMTLARYQALSIPVLTTAEYGTITAQSDGERVKINTFFGEKEMVIR